MKNKSLFIFIIMIFLCLNVTAQNNFDYQSLPFQNVSIAKKSIKFPLNSPFSEQKTQTKDWLLSSIISELFLFSYHVIYKFPSEPSLWATLEEGGTGFTKYPYKENKLGMYHKPFDGGRAWSGEFRGHYYFGEPYQGLYGDWRFSPISTFNIEASNHFLFRTGLDGNRKYSDITNIGITYNRLRHSRFNINYGLGFFNIREENYYGISLMLAMSYYFWKPFSIHYSGQYTPYDGIGMGIHQFRAQYHFRKFYAYTGIHRIRNSEIDNRGVMLGMGVYY